MPQKVPILFIVFNRPGKTTKVLDEIAKYQPDVIYLAADGPREHNEEDLEKCTAVRMLLEEKINWPCKINKLYGSSNQGCRTAVSKAISWFFFHEPYGVILEDDCLPSESFFEFASYMLKYYEHDSKIHSISGCNLGYEPSNNSASVIYSRYMNMWGWASWQRVAKEIDYDLKGWNSRSRMSKFFFLFKYLAFFHKDFDPGWIAVWKNKFDLIVKRNYDTWDYQWFYQQFKTKTLTVFPTANLIQNIGNDLDATHTKSEDAELFPLKTLKTPFKIYPDYNIDTFFEEKFIKAKWVTYNRYSLTKQFFNSMIYVPLRQLYAIIYYAFFVDSKETDFKAFNKMGVRKHKKLNSAGGL